MSRPSTHADVPCLSYIRTTIFEADLFSQGEVEAFDRLLQEAGYSLDDVPYIEPPDDDDPNEGLAEEFDYGVW